MVTREDYGTISVILLILVVLVIAIVPAWAWLDINPRADAFETRVTKETGVKIIPKDLGKGAIVQTVKGPTLIQLVPTLYLYEKEFIEKIWEENITIIYRYFREFYAVSTTSGFWYKHEVL